MRIREEIRHIFIAIESLRNFLLHFYTLFFHLLIECFQAPTHVYFVPDTHVYFPFVFTACFPMAPAGPVLFLSKWLSSVYVINTICVIIVATHKIRTL